MKTKLVAVITSVLISSLLFSTVQDVFADKNTFSVDIDYTVKIGNQKHLVHLTACAENEQIVNPHIVFYSPQEIKEISLKKILPAKTCQSYEVTLQAKHADRIGVITFQ